MKTKEIVKMKKIKNILKPPTKEEALQLIINQFDEVYASTQGQNLINELHLCNHFELTYVDKKGYDSIDKKSNELIELKTTDARTLGRAQWGSCGVNKSKADFFIFWDKKTGQFAKVSNKDVQNNLQNNGIKTRLSDNPGGISKHILTSNSWFK